MSAARPGELEELVLLAIGGLGSGAYTVAVQRRLAEEAGRSVTMGAVYTSLSRLEDKGFVTSRLGAVTPKRGGKRKRLYQLTDAGIQALTDARTARDRLWAGWHAAPDLAR